MTALQRQINRTTGVNRNSGTSRANRNRLMEDMLTRGYTRQDADTLRPDSDRDESGS